MNRRKKMSPKCLSNRQKVKEQAKELKRLQYERKGYEIRNNYLREIVLEQRKEIDKQARTIEALKSEMRELELELTVKKPFWKRVLG